MEKLYQKAQEFADQFEYELAAKFCKKALEIDGEHFDCLHMLASLHVELGDMESAIHVYRQIIQKYQHDYKAYVALAELLSSIEYYELGLKAFASQGVEDDLTLSDIYCSIAELYLLTEQENQLDHASKYIELATNCNPRTDAQISYLKSQIAASKGLPKEQIITHLDQCIMMMMTAEDKEGQLSPSSYDMKFEVAKLFLSFGIDDYESTNKAIQILYDLLDEQDDDPDLCFILGRSLIDRKSTSNTQGEEDDIHDGRLLLERAKEIYGQIDGPYQSEQLCIINEMLSLS